MDTENSNSTLDVLFQGEETARQDRGEKGAKLGGNLLWRKNSSNVPRMTLDSEEDIEDNGGEDIEDGGEEDIEDAGEKDIDHNGEKDIEHNGGEDIEGDIEDDGKEDIEDDGKEGIEGGGKEDIEDDGGEEIENDGETSSAVVRMKQRIRTDESISSSGGYSSLGQPQHLESDPYDNNSPDFSDSASGSIGSIETEEEVTPLQLEPSVLDGPAIQPPTTKALHGNDYKPRPIKNFDDYKLETQFYDNHVIHSTYKWEFATRMWEQSKWTKKRIVGTGAYGEVWLEQEEKGKLRAVKKLSKRPADFTQELLALIKLKGHTHLFLEFFGWYENKNHIFLAMEYIEHGTLAEYIKASEKAKKEAKEITRQILEGLEVLHDKGICHRDLKPENVLIASIAPIWVKIADFGISKRTKHTFLRTRCGTDGYLAPELLGALPRQKFKTRESSEMGETFTYALDIWSLGCLLHQTLTSHKPFFNTDNDEDDEYEDESGIFIDTGLVQASGQLDMVSLVEYCKGGIEFPTEILRRSEVDEGGIGFVISLLAAIPEDRPTAARALRNPWLVEDYTCEWFENLINEFSCLGVDLDLGSKEKTSIFIRQTGKLDIMQFLPASAKEGIPSILLDAAAKGYSLAISRILESSYSLELVDDITRGKLFQLAAETEQLDTIKILIQKELNVDIRIDNKTILQWAAKAEKFSIAIVLLESEINIRRNKRYIDELRIIDCQETLRLATEAVRITRLPAKGDYYDVLRLLLNRMADIMAKEIKDGYRTALQYAAGNGHINIVRLLLDTGANLGEALQVAANGGHVDISKLLLENGAGVNARLEWDNHKTPLQAAAGSGHIDIVKLLLDNEVDVNTELTEDKGRTALQAAAEGGYTDICKLLLSSEADVNAQPAVLEGRTALQAACGGGHMDTVRLLLETKADVNAAASEESGRTALQAAAEGGYIEIVKLLLDEGASLDVDGGIWGGMTALQAAARSGNIDTVKLLLENDADVNAKAVECGNGRTALQAAAEGGHIDIVQLLLDNGANINTMLGEFDRSALEMAADGGYIDIVKLLIDNGAKVNTRSGDSTDYPNTALESAAAIGHIGISKLLLDNGATDNAKYSTALELAASGGHIGVVKLLLNSREYVDLDATPTGRRVRRHRYKLALVDAIEGGNIDVVKLLLDNGANPNLIRSGLTALGLAAGSGNIGIVEELLKSGADINAGKLLVLDRYSTALQAAAKGGHLKVVDFLLNNGARVNAKPAHLDGRTALQAAAEGGHIDTVKFLLDNDAKVNAKPGHGSGRTALQAAANGGHMDTVKLLLDNGANPNAKPSMISGRTALEAAASNGHTKIVKLLLDNCADINAKPVSNSGLTALQAAAEGGHTDTIKLLLDNGAHINVNPPIIGGQTILEVALKKKCNIEAFQLLLDNGADPNIKPSVDCGQTPLEIAAHYGNIEFVKLLLDKGADVNATPGLLTGKSALQQAITGRHIEVVKLLLDNGANVNARRQLKSDRTPLETAADTSSVEMVKLMLDSGADTSQIPFKWGVKYGCAEIMEILRRKP